MDRATSYWKLSHTTPDPDVRDRFVAIAQHYRALAVAERSIADQYGSRGDLFTTNVI